MTHWLTVSGLFALSLLFYGWRILSLDAALHRQLASHSSDQHTQLLIRHLRRQRHEIIFVFLFLGLIMSLLTYLTDQPATASVTACTTIPLETTAIEMQCPAPKIEPTAYPHPTGIASEAVDPLASLFDPLSPFTSREQLKPSYEDILIGTLILARCALIDTATVEELNQRLYQSLYQIIGDQAYGFYKNMRSAAEGSYALFYADSDCTSAQIIALKPKFDVLLASLVEGVMLQ